MVLDGEQDKTMGIRLKEWLRGEIVLRVGNFVAPYLSTQWRVFTAFLVVQGRVVLLQNSSQLLPFLRIKFVILWKALVRIDVLERHDNDDDDLM